MNADSIYALYNRIFFPTDKIYFVNETPERWKKFCMRCRRSLETIALTSTHSLLCLEHAATKPMVCSVLLLQSRTT
jgi:hypothetical protein